MGSSCRKSWELRRHVDMRCAPPEAGQEPTTKRNAPAAVSDARRLWKTVNLEAARSTEAAPAHGRAHRILQPPRAVGLHQLLKHQHKAALKGTACGVARRRQSGGN